MSFNRTSSFYRRGTSVTEGLQDQTTPTSRFSTVSSQLLSNTPSTVGRDSEGSTVSVHQKLDSLLLLVGDLKEEFHAELQETKSSIQAVKEDLEAFKKSSVSTSSQGKKPLPRDISVS